MPILIAVLLQATVAQLGAPAAATPAPVAPMAALFDEACLRAFPSDEAVAATMARRTAIPLTPEQVRVTLGDDPGRGWIVRDRGAPPVMVMLELPPYHACSVRSMIGSGPHDLAPYRAVAARYRAAHPGFSTLPGIDGERDGIRMRAEQEGRLLPDGTAELLIVVEQSVSDATKLAPGQTAAPLRFVHLLRAPGGAGAPH